MITRDPYGLNHVEKPWGGLSHDQEPAKCIIRTIDPPELVEMCLNCKKKRCGGSCLAVVGRRGKKGTPFHNTR